MTEFSKLKIAFSLALLGAVFAVSPLIKEYGVFAYKLFGLSLSVKLGYSFFALFLGSAVYFYAVALIGESVYFDAAKTAGNIAYTVALIIPPLYLLLYPVSLLADLAFYLLKSPWAAGVLQTLLGGIVAVAVQATARVLFGTFRKKDRSERIAKLEEEGNTVLSRARKLFGEGYFDISVTESWKAIEIALRRAFYNQDIQVRGTSGWNLIRLATEKELLSAQQAQEISIIRKLRNDAVHTEAPVTKEEAQKAINVSDKVIASLEKATEQCYFCNARYPRNTLEEDDFTGAYICNKCLKKHPNWKDDLAAMGMDP